MTQKYLQIFSEVCRQGSITRAAEELYMAQPAVSHVIREMEEYYGTRLFERMNRRLYITDAGTRLLQYADSILAQFDEAKDVLQSLDAVTQVRVGANASYGISGLPDLLAGFCKTYPEIPVYTVIQNSRQIEEQLLKNSLDFGVMDEPVHSDLLIGRMIGWDKMTVVCGMEFEVPEEEMELADVLTLPLLVRENGSGLRKMVDDLIEREQVRARIVTESVSMLSLIELCERGLGILVLPETVAVSYLEQGRLKRIRITDADLKREYFLVSHRAKFCTKSMEKFQDYVMRYVSRVPADSEQEIKQKNKR